QIAQTLELEAQLWLLQLMHHSYWQAWHQPQVHPRLERSLLQLSSYVQPRLVWEVLLWELSSWSSF
ncbi:MAG: DNA polymerase III subunit delta', partial [Pseudanabaenaceae cyanobacterium bins.68]|nr:DNA polymerase III subunit delta' [Pseudanabaenaceae cyanobacterium bins.68]